MEGQRSLMEALKGQADASTALLARATADAASPSQLPSVSVADYQLNALAGIKFEQTVPVLPDSDPDFERRWR
eukprot:12698522-Alexandrium_andersonii.AAC.1